MKHYRWTTSEIEALRKVYPTGDIVRLARQLDRPLSSIYWKASKLGIRRKVYTKHERRRRDNLYPEMPRPYNLKYTFTSLIRKFKKLFA